MRAIRNAGLAATHLLTPIKRRIILHASGFAGDLPAAAAPPD